MSSWDEEIHELFGKRQDDPDAIDDIVESLHNPHRSQGTFSNLEKILDRPNKHKPRVRADSSTDGSSQRQPQASIPPALKP